MTGQLEQESRSPLHVLVAEDDRTTRLLLQHTISKWGYRVSVAASGHAGLEVIKKEPVRLVISDWEMPGMSGLTLCREVRKLERGAYIYFIMLTSLSSKENLIHALNTGVDEFLAKPFDPIELQARLSVGARILGLQDELLEKNRALEALNAKLQNAALTDHLMEIGNRRNFAEKIAKMHALSLEQGVPYGVIMADIDDFKKYNDFYGHPQGDVALATVAKTLKQVSEGEGELFRYGGEELIFLSQPTSREALCDLAERMRAAIEAKAIPHEQAVGRDIVSMSFGVTYFDPQEQAWRDCSWEEVVDWADQGLYKAKERGRNCVVFGAPTPKE